MERFLVSLSTGAASIAILAVLFTVPSLYNTINEVHDQVLDGVSVFRVETDSAWTEIMNAQIIVTPPSKPRANPFNSIFRQKRHTFSGLPAWCQCEPKKPICPLGPPGPPGQPGTPGTPGVPGPKGEDNTSTYAPIHVRPDSLLLLPVTRFVLILIYLLSYLINKHYCLLVDDCKNKRW